MSFLTEIAEDHIGMEDDMGNPTFTYSGVNYPCTHSTVASVVELDYGTRVIYTITLRVRTTNITGEIPTWDWSSTGGPDDGDTITFDGKTFKLLNKRDTFKKLFVFELGDPSV